VTNNIKKLTNKAILVLALFSFLVLPLKVQAISVSPTTSTFQSGINQTIQIVASNLPNSTTSAVNLRITLSGVGQIVNFTRPTTGWQFFVSVCPGSTDFTTTLVCVDMTRTSGNYLVSGDSLGTLVIKGTASGTITLTATGASGSELGSGYTSGGIFYARTGTLGTYTVTSSIPNTAIEDVEWGVVLGISMIILGGALYISSKKRKFDF
jgi:LPXTG-motif cell wall-anchored protein